MFHSSILFHRVSHDDANTDTGESTTTEELLYLSKADDDFTPDYLWNLDAAHHGATGNPSSPYAVLHDATLTTGPQYPSDLLSGAVQFGGHPGSYMEVVNVNGCVNALQVFTWAMVVQPDDQDGQGVIMEYNDGVGRWWSERRGGGGGERGEREGGRERE